MARVEFLIGQQASLMNRSELSGSLADQTDVLPTSGVKSATGSTVSGSASSSTREENILRGNERTGRNFEEAIEIAEFYGIELP
ncbi:Hypothetical protein NTJ_06985 [Nesidiocoris tenuis]|uniref:Uncharacterized protein n=1 Tax=Nesidiocoris tenuis TaxID=355587 RepID=A0ABN7APN0_9HEMI|nr:Hypothetical protein NTJ_06985 [Nesidiocoris tenuis]